MNIKERVYLIEILRGLYITSRHFVVNICLHIFHLFGLFKDKKAGVTIQYPEERRQIGKRCRTRHRLLKREDGSIKCVACMLCATICPTQCITIEAGEHPEEEIEKYPVKYEIDILRCAFCGLCVFVCPKDAIRMDTGILEMADYSRDRLIYDLEYLSKEG